MFNFFKKKPNDKEIASKIIEYLDLITKYSKEFEKTESYSVASDNILAFYCLQQKTGEDYLNIKKGVANISSNGRSIKKLNTPEMISLHKSFKKLRISYDKLFNVSLYYIDTRFKLHLELYLEKRKRINRFAVYEEITAEKIMRRNKMKNNIPKIWQKVYDTAQETYQNLLALSKDLSKALLSIDDTDALNSIKKKGYINLEAPHFRNIEYPALIALSSLHSKTDKYDLMDGKIKKMS